MGGQGQAYPESMSWAVCVWGQQACVGRVAGLCSLVVMQQGCKPQLARGGCAPPGFQMLNRESGVNNHGQKKLTIICPPCCVMPPPMLVGGASAAEGLLA